ncbi:hypothetical protein KV557_10070 [Kitasatospora aureofaciens]|uniref:hypothetical protein n=1 Tax=Kitasatospora aureofaciens TaxID=1894 RepID=UPI001C450479|nr:hypothetical protein [Kitasatospora aureofaciens]MBV6697470.1 hypothetical protein [Kitasatospora aureofaciens]
MTSAYQHQLVQQLRAAEDELGHRRRQVAELADELTATRARVIRSRTAWWSACRRAADYRASLDHTIAAAERGSDDLARIAHDQLTRAEQAEVCIAAVRALAADMRTWCSPHGIAVDYADRIDEVLDRTTP